MGILKSREELLPVTCAILKDQERDEFFAAARKKVGGSLERLASICEVANSTVADWQNGKVNIPYHALQRLAQELEVELPQVTELRREYQQVTHKPAPRRYDPPPPSAEPAREKRSRESRRGERQPKKERGQRQDAQRTPKQPRGQKQQKPQQPRRERKQSPHAKDGAAASSKAPGLPKLSDKLAYWCGALFSAARFQESTVVLSADKHIGQNFAATWANLTADLFGARPALTLSEDHKVQDASFSSGGLEEFLARLEFKPGSTPAEAPGAPRWTWSNPDWKTAFLKGVVDASARFHRTPSLNLEGLSPRLLQSIQKMLTSLGFAPKAGPDQSLTLEGAQDVEKYFEIVGTSNMKLKDQFKAYRQGGSEPSDEADEQAPAPQDAAEASSFAAETPSEEAPEKPAAKQQPGSSPAAARKPRRPRRTRYRGKPGQ